MCIKKMFKLAVAVFILVVARSRGSDESDGEDIDRVRDEKVPGEADDKNNLDTEHLYRPHTVNCMYLWENTSLSSMYPLFVCFKSYNQLRVSYTIHVLKM